MTRLRWILLVLLTPSLLLAGPRASMREGLNAYASTNYEAAVQHFREAAETAMDERLDPAVAHLNLGNALLKSEQPELAAEAYREATRTSDLKLQGKAHYNLGNTLAGQAKTMAAGGQAQEALDVTKSALGHYRQSISLDPSDLDRKNNFEMTLQLKKLIEEMLQQQQQQNQQNQDQQDQDDQQNQDQQDQQNQDQQNQDQQDQQNQDQQDQGDQDKEQDQQDQQGEQDQQQQQNQDQDGDSDSGSSGSPPPPSEEMTPEEARMLLEALKEEENAKREKVRVRLGRPVQVDKDW